MKSAILVLTLSLFIAGCCEPVAEDTSTAKAAWLDAMRVGKVLVADYDMRLVESTTEFDKYRVRDNRPGAGYENYMYVTVKRGIIVSLWVGKKQ